MIVFKIIALVFSLYVWGYNDDSNLGKAIGISGVIYTLNQL